MFLQFLIIFIIEKVLPDPHNAIPQAKPLYLEK
jgi:hypothetical protein